MQKELAMNLYLKEIEIWRKLAHPNILQLLSVYQDEKHGIIQVMPLMKCSLYDYFNKLHLPPFNFRTATHVMRCIAAGLACISF